MLLNEPIKRDQLILVDICPYPNWAPGFIQSTFNRIQQTIVSE